MAVKKILSTDTLETGFRAKYNETVDEIITGYSYPAAVGVQPNGYTLRLNKFGGGYIDINLQQFYYTKQQVTDLVNGIISAVTAIPTEFPQFFIFTYDGTNNTLALDFIPIRTTGFVLLNNSPILAEKNEYNIDVVAATITINPDLLTVGMEQQLYIRYYIASE